MSERSFLVCSELGPRRLVLRFASRWLSPFVSDSISDWSFWDGTFQNEDGKESISYSILQMIKPDGYCTF